jgi:hypothetical protein
MAEVQNGAITVAITKEGNVFHIDLQYETISEDMAWEATKSVVNFLDEVGKTSPTPCIDRSSGMRRWR